MSGTTLVRHSDTNVRIGLAEDDEDHPSGWLVAAKHAPHIANPMNVLATNALDHIG